MKVQLIVLLISTLATVAWANTPVCGTVASVSTHVSQNSGPGGTSATIVSDDGKSTDVFISWDYGNMVSILSSALASGKAVCTLVDNDSGANCTGAHRCYVDSVTLKR